MEVGPKISDVGNGIGANVLRKGKMSFRVSLDRTITGWSIFLMFAVCLHAHADLNILAVGDSHTVGKNEAPIFRSSYRTYLDQSIRNFQSLGISDADTVNVNWLGAPGGTTGPVPNDSPIAVDNNWTNRHLAESGIAARNYDPSDAYTALNATSPGDRNLVLMLLGTNEFGMFPSTDTHGWASNDFIPTRVVDSIGNIIAGFPADTETLIAAIPPVDERRRYVAADNINNVPGTPGNLWYESERITGSNGQHQDLVHWDGVRFVIGGGTDVDANGNPLATPIDASSNDIIDAVNYAFFQLAESNANVTFIDPFLSSGGYQLQGPTIAPVEVNNGASFNRTPDGNGQLDLLTDGIHLAPIAEQYYAAAFWEGGVRSALTETAAAQAIPEPSSFLFLGLLSMLVGSARRFFTNSVLRELH